MKITPKIDDRRLRQRFDKQIQTQPRQVQIALGRTAEFLMDIIKTRTQKGKDADGRNFLPYSSEYAGNLIPSAPMPFFDLSLIKPITKKAVWDNAF